MSWVTKPNIHSPGTAYVVDETGSEIAFCQTIEDAERIAKSEAERDTAIREVGTQAREVGKLTAEVKELRATVERPKQVLGDFYDFRDHDIWTADEIYRKLYKVAKSLNPRAVTVYGNYLSDDGGFCHYTGNPTIAEKGATNENSSRSY